MKLTKISSKKSTIIGNTEGKTLTYITNSEQASKGSVTQKRTQINKMLRPFSLTDVFVHKKK